MAVKIVCEWLILLLYVSIVFFIVVVAIHRTKVHCVDIILC